MTLVDGPASGQISASVSGAFDRLIQAPAQIVGRDRAAALASSAASSRLRGLDDQVAEVARQYPPRAGLRGAI
jgi:hypothetical protein